MKSIKKLTLAALAAILALAFLVQPALAERYGFALTVRKPDATVISGASVSVYTDAALTTPATVYDAYSGGSSTATAPQATTNAYGQAQFWVDTGTYGPSQLFWVKVTSGSYTYTLEAVSLVPAGYLFTSGTLTHEAGGLEDDVSAYDGLLKISGGATSAVSLPLGVANGGTGLASLAQYCLYVGNATGAPQSLGVGTDGQIIVGNTGANPAWADNLPVGAMPTGGTWTLSTDLVVAGDVVMNTSKALYFGASKEARIISDDNQFDIETTDAPIRFGISNPHGTFSTYLYLSGGYISYNGNLIGGANHNLGVGNPSFGTGAANVIAVGNGTKPSTHPTAYFYAASGEMHVVDTSGNDSTISADDAIAEFADWYAAHPDVPPWAFYKSQAYTGQKWAVNMAASLYYQAHPEETPPEGVFYKLVEQGPGRDWAADQAAIKAKVDSERAAVREAKVAELMRKGRAWAPDAGHPEGGAWVGGLSREEAEAAVPAVEPYQERPEPAWITARKAALKAKE